MVTDAPCQEVVITGADLDRDGAALDGLPVPISTPGWDNAPYLSAGHYITKDPDSGIQNVGNYRGQLKAPRRLGMNPSVELRAGIFAHWEKCKARGEPLPCAVVVGCPPVDLLRVGAEDAREPRRDRGGGRARRRTDQRGARARPSTCWCRRRPRS